MGKVPHIFQQARTTLRRIWLGWFQKKSSSDYTPRRSSASRVAATPSRRQHRRWGGETLRERLGQVWHFLERSTGLTTGVVIIFVIVAGWAVTNQFVRIPITNITVARSDALVDIDLANQTLGDLPEDMSYFSLPTATITKVIRESQPNVAQAIFERTFPNKLSITLASYPATFVTHEGEKEGIITSNGVLVLRPMPHQTLPELRVVFTDGRPVTQAFNYRRVLDPEDANRANAFVKALSGALQENILRVSFFPQERELHAEIGTGRTILLFDADADFEKPLRMLRFYASKKGNPLVKDAWFYADLRVPNKIFSCSVEKTRDCRKNLVGVYGNAYAYVAPVIKK